MATTIRLIAVRALSPPTQAAQHGLAVVSGPTQGPGSWETLTVDRRPPLAGFDRALAQLGDHSTAVLGAAVEDGDYAYLAWWAGKGDATRAVVGREAARDYQDGDWALRNALTSMEQVSASLSRWSRLAPEEVTVERARAVLESDRLDKVDLVSELLGLLGLSWPATDELSKFAGAVHLITKPTRDVGQKEVPRSYVAAMGRGFVGIWRSSGGEPIRRFGSDRQGRMEALTALRELERMEEV